MKTYAVRLAMETERQSLDAVERRLQRVRESAERQGFHISELSVRGLDSDERAELAGGSAK